MRLKLIAGTILVALAACGPQGGGPKGPSTPQPKADKPAPQQEATAAALDVCALVADTKKIFGTDMVVNAGRSGDGVAGACVWTAAEGAVFAITASASIMTDESLKAAGQDKTAKKAFEENIAEARAAAIIDIVTGVGEAAFWQQGKGGNGKLQFFKGDKLARLSVSMSDPAADPKKTATALGAELAKGL